MREVSKSVAIPAGSESFGYRRLRAVLAVLLLVAAAIDLRAQPPVARDTAGRRIIMITGSTDGLGREVAVRIAATGAHVIVHGRNLARGDSVVAAIAAEGVGSARFYPADFASLAAVRALAERVLEDYGRLDVLVNNAGIWLMGNTRSLSADGHELHFAVNYLSSYLLTRMLLPRLTAVPGARIINVASTAQTPLQFDDLNLSNGYTDSRGYGQSKLAQVIFTMDLAAELRDRGVTVVALHPATLMATNMVLSRGTAPRATVQAGADAVLNLITSPDITTGTYYSGLTPARANQQAYDLDAQRRLRETSTRLTGAGG